MRCPECNQLLEADAKACTSCGLLVLNMEATLKRRRDDAARRRAVDLAKTLCPYCHGEIENDVVRCRHCSQIVDPEFRKKRQQRRRAQINYASWVAYIFGLITFVFFKPVGMIAIGAGLMLSIAYYAIPVDMLDDTIARRLPLRKRAVKFLKNQLRFERVHIPLPHFGKLKLVFVGTPIVAALVGFIANFFFLQKPMNDILRQHEMFRGMQVSTHYQYWVVPGVVVYDLKQVSGKQTPLDVYTALLEYADRLQQSRIREVKLSFRGEEKYSIEGSAFRRLGEEYSKRNFAWVLSDFPTLATSGDSAPPAKAASPREALIEFHNHWFVDEMKRAPRDQSDMMTMSIQQIR